MRSLRVLHSARRRCVSAAAAVVVGTNADVGLPFSFPVASTMRRGRSTLASFSSPPFSPSVCVASPATAATAAVVVEPRRSMTTASVPSSATPIRPPAATSPTPSTGSVSSAGDESRKIIKKVVKKKKKVGPPPSSASTETPSSSSSSSTSATRPTVLRPVTPTVAAVRKPAGTTPPTTAAAPATPTPTPAPAGTPPATTEAKKKTAMIKSYKLEDVSSVCGPHDALFARRLPTGGCQFFAWPGTPLDVAGRAIVSMPDSIRTVHSIFGRKNAALDLVMDIDCPVPPEHWSMVKIKPFQEKLLDDTLTVVAEAIAKAGETVQSQVVLQSPNLKKVSFHVHIKLKDAAFADYESVLGFLAPWKEKIPSVDLQIYRPNGMLRMFSCMKENHTSAMVVFPTTKWNKGVAVKEDGTVSDAVAALHSICIREPGTFQRLITCVPPVGYYMPPPHPSTVAPLGTRDGSAAGGRGGSSEASGGARGEPSSVGSTSTTTTADGEKKGSLFPVVEMPRTAQETVENCARWLQHTTEVEVGEWRNWIGIGICAFRVAFHFKDHPKLPQPAMDTLLQAWIEGSQRCPSKFKPGDCEHKWNTFDPNKLTSGDWWSAYQRLGRLSFATEEARERDATRQREKEARMDARRRGTAGGGGGVPSTPPTTSLHPGAGSSASSVLPAEGSGRSPSSSSSAGPSRSMTPVGAVPRSVPTTPSSSGTSPAAAAVTRRSPLPTPPAGSPRSSSAPLPARGVPSSTSPLRPASTTTTTATGPGAGVARPAAPVQRSTSAPLPSTIARSSTTNSPLSSSGSANLSSRGSSPPSPANSTNSSSSSSSSSMAGRATHPTVSASPPGAGTTSPLARSAAAVPSALPSPDAAAALRPLVAKKKLRKIVK